MPSFKSILKTLLPRYQTLHLEYPVDMKPRYGYGLPPHILLNSIIERNRSIYEKTLLEALGYNDHFLTLPLQANPENTSLPNWQNGFLPGLDIVMLYTMVASMQPSTYVEIGSGNSTKVAAWAKKNHQLATQIVSIDPMPRAEIDALADTVIRKPIEIADRSVFTSLGKGDIVFVDNSHRIFPNSDATVFFLDILPMLAEGVIVQVHDIYLPFDYPQDVCDRYYSEQYALAAFILANPEKYNTIMPNYFVSEDKKLSNILNPLWEKPQMTAVERHGASYWFTIGK